LERILPKNTQDRLIGFLRRRGQIVAAHSHGLAPLLEDFTHTPCSLNVALEAPSWINARCISDADADHAYAAALFAAHLYAQGQHGSWRVEFARPHCVRFGRLVTPQITFLAVDGPQIEYHTAEGMTQTTVLSPNGNGLRELMSVSADSQPAILLAEERDSEIFGIGVEEFSTADLPTRVDEAEKAIRLIRDHAPEYLAWYGDVVRVLVALPAHPQPGGVCSGTSSGQNGVTYASSPCRSIRLAETLIHEASHQYFSFGQLEINYCNQNDDSLYYSPYKQLDRPIERILLAYHAFSNVLLFYRAIAARTENEALLAWARNIVKHHEATLRTFGKYLEASPGLMSAGRLMYQTLAEKIYL
jgi:hypothetical protein